MLAPMLRLAVFSLVFSLCKLSSPSDAENLVALSVNYWTGLNLIEKVSGEEGFAASRTWQSVACVRFHVGQPGHL